MCARVLIADDNDVYRRMLGRFISVQSDLEVVGEATDGLAAVTMCNELNPDVVVMDLRMPGVDGFEATRRMKEQVPSAHVIAITAHRTEGDESDCMAAGAEAFVPKARADAELIQAIRMLVSVSPELNGHSGSTFGGVSCD